MNDETQEKQSRPPLSRMNSIHKWCKEKNYLTAIEMAMELEMDERTIKRDIEYMRLHFKAPIEFDRKREGYYYSEDFKSGIQPHSNLRGPCVLCVRFIKPLRFPFSFSSLFFTLCTIRRVSAA